jgi:hypothetical protein
MEPILFQRTPSITRTKSNETHYLEQNIDINEIIEIFNLHRFNMDNNLFDEMLLLEANKFGFKTVDEYLNYKNKHLSRIFIHSNQ